MTMNNMNNLGCSKDALGKCPFFSVLSNGLPAGLLSVFVQSISLFALGKIDDIDNLPTILMVFALSRLAITVSTPKIGKVNTFLYGLDNVIAILLIVVLIPIFAGVVHFARDNESLQWLLITTSDFVFPNLKIMSLSLIWIMSAISLAIYIITWAASAGTTRAFVRDYSPEQTSQEADLAVAKKATAE